MFRFAMKCTFDYIIFQKDQQSCLCHNIFELCNVLVHVQYATRKTNLDIYNKLGIRLASRVGKQPGLGSEEIRKY